MEIENRQLILVPEWNQLKTISPEQLKDFIFRSRVELLNLRLREGEKFSPYSINEYFWWVAQEGLNALEEGNRGIGAIYIYRKDGVEIIVKGHNCEVSTQNTNAHAEENAIDFAEAINRREPGSQSRILLYRSAPTFDTRQEVILATGIDPCPGCYRRIMTNRANTILIGRVDPDGSGVFYGEGMVMPFWKKREKRQGVKATLVNGDLHPALSRMLLDTFLINREQLDNVSALQQGLVPMDHFLDNASYLIGTRYNLGNPNNLK